MGSANEEKSAFIQKLKEKQENQRALVQAIEDLQVEQVKLRNKRIKAVLVFLGFIGICVYSFDAIKPYVSSLWTETWRPSAKMDENEIFKAVESRPQPAKVGVDAVLPTPVQEAAVTSFVTPLPARQDDDAFYATFRPPPPEAAERLAQEYLAYEAAAPSRESYHSVNQLDSQVAELDRMVELDKLRR